MNEEHTTKKFPVPFPHFEKADVYALQAIERGNATPEQQKRGLHWIISYACLTDDFCNVPQDPRLSAIFDGRRFAGLRIRKLLKLDPTKLKDD
jgi:hypothetical protein